MKRQAPRIKIPNTPFTINAPHISATIIMRNEKINIKPMIALTSIVNPFTTNE